MMLNLDMLINYTPLPDELKEIAGNINDTLTKIMVSGANGDF
mgnify:CR=1 FL=1